MRNTLRTSLYSTVTAIAAFAGAVGFFLTSTGLWAPTLALPQTLNRESMVPAWVFVLGFSAIIVLASIACARQIKTAWQVKHAYATSPAWWASLVTLPAFGWIASQQLVHIDAISETTPAAALAYPALGIAVALVIAPLPRIHALLTEPRMVRMATRVTIAVACVIAAATRFIETTYSWEVLLSTTIWSACATWALYAARATQTTSTKASTGESTTPEHTTVHSLTSPRTRTWVCLILIVLALGIGAAQRIAAVDTVEFQNDEYYHVDAAKGYNETGTLLRWNWQTHQPTEVLYERSHIYTKLVALSIRAFGTEQEWAFRLPSLISALLLLLLTPVIAYALTRDTITALLATVFMAFDDGFIWSAVQNRMYAFFFVVALVWAACYMVAIRTKPLSTRTGLDRVIRLVLILVATAGAYATADVHYVMLLLIPTFALGSLVLWLVLKRRTDRDAILLWLVGGIAGVIAHTTLTPWIPWALATLRTDIAIPYLWYPVSKLVLPLVAITMLGIGTYILALRNTAQRPLVLYSLVAYWSMITYFIFLSDRYPSRKYAMVCLLVAGIAIAYAWSWLWQRATTNVFIQSVGAAFTALLCWVFLSIPGVPAQTGLTITAYADRSPKELESVDYTTSYGRLKKAYEGHTADDAAVYILLPRTYYLQDAPFETQIIPIEKEATLADLQITLAQYPTTFLYWEIPKEQTHLRRDVRSYIKKHCTAIKMPGTSARLYQCTAK